MFGSNNLTQQSNDDPAMLNNVRQLATQPTDDITAPIDPATQQSSPFTPTAVPGADPVAADEHTAEPAEGFSSTPVEDPAPSNPDNVNENDTTSNESAETHAQSDPVSTPVPDSTPVQLTSTQAPDQNHLADLKKQALDHLEPLADHVNGTPEETFKNTMMMIQANDNHTLLEKALEAAKNIEDDKVRAKAMLDVINEINYFSQNSSDE